MLLSYKSKHIIKVAIPESKPKYIIKDEYHRLERSKTNLCVNEFIRGNPNIKKRPLNQNKQLTSQSNNLKEQVTS